MKKRVALVAGGDSGEYEVSINSAKAVMQALSSEVYNVYFIHMKKADWFYVDDKDHKVVVDKNDFSICLDEKKITFDVAFIIIHGTPGEDGKLQGYFDLIGLPYTTCDVFTSAMTFKKNFTKHVATALDVPVSKTLYLKQGESFCAEQMIKTVGLPCFVKPNKGGSSVGITKVKTGDQFEEAVATAFAEDDEVLVEENLSGIEIGCGVYQAQGEIVALPLTEIVSKTEFFDYEAKYLGASDEITPARISEEKTKLCQEVSVRLYREFNCKGVVRFDYILQKDTFYFLEVNTVPGLSEASIVPQQIRYLGLKEGEVYAQLIEEALRR